MNFIIYGKGTVIGGIEIEFISQQSKVIAQGTATGNGVLVTHTVPDLKTFVLLGSQVTVSGSGGDFSFTGDLRFNSVSQHLAQFGYVATGNGLPLIWNTILRGMTFVGDGVKAIDINLGGITGANQTVAGIIYGYEITT